jgi:hypothetical protein
MSRTTASWLGILLLMAGCQPASKTKTSDDTRSGWVELFNGTGTDHWRGFHIDHFPDSGWYVDNGELRNDGSGAGGLVTREQYASFILEWEWRFFDEGGNSGVKYFVKERPDREGKYAFGLEYQMLDDGGHDYQANWMAGALYDLLAPSADKKLNPYGQFNTSRLVVEGDHVEHWLNGIKVVEYERGGEDFQAAKAKSKFHDRPDYGLHREGHILLQDHNSRIGFRNIRIRVLANPQ